MLQVKLSHWDAWFDVQESTPNDKLSGGEAVRSDALLDAVESLRVRLSDGETLAQATLAYYRETHSTAATVALLRCRELLEQIASNSMLDMTSRSCTKPTSSEKES